MYSRNNLYFFLQLPKYYQHAIKKQTKHIHTYILKHWHNTAHYTQMSLLKIKCFKRSHSDYIQAILRFAICRALHLPQSRKILNCICFESIFMCSANNKANKRKKHINKTHILMKDWKKTPPAPPRHFLNRPPIYRFFCNSWWSLFPCCNCKEKKNTMCHN